MPSLPSSSRPCGAKEWVVGYLSAHGGEALAADAIEAGRLVGFPASTVKNARPKVADSIRVGFGRAQKTYWRLRAVLAAADVPTTGTLDLADAAGPTSPAGPAGPADPAAATKPTGATKLAETTGSARTAGPAKAVDPARPAHPARSAGVASPQPERSHRRRRRPAATPAPGLRAEQPTLFAVMGVSEP